MAEEHQEYGDAMVAMLELIWGAGYLSPGGPEEVARTLDDVDLAGRRVLDIGCGTGGIDIELARKFGAARVTGVDIEAPNIELCRRRAAEQGLADRIDYVLVRPGPLPFPDGSFDAVFSKDSIIHIEDKETLFQDLHRVLAPNGVFVASDWLGGHDGPPSALMQAYLDAEGLSFGLASAARYEAAMRAAGFTDVRTRDRNAWYLDTARREVAAIEGPLRPRMLAAIGEAETERQTRVWRTMLAVLETGELRPTHLYGRKSG